MSRQEISSLKPTRRNLQMMPLEQLNCEVCTRRRQGRSTGTHKHTNDNGCMKTGIGRNGKPLILYRMEDFACAEITCGMIDKDGNICTYRADKVTVRTHQRRAHRAQHVIRQRVITNQCPYCAAIFFERRGAGDHVERVLRDGGCPDKPGGRPNRGIVTIIAPAKIHCRRCTMPFKTLNEYNAHVRAGVCYKEKVKGGYMLMDRSGSSSSSWNNANPRGGRRQDGGTRG